MDVNMCPLSRKDLFYETVKQGGSDQIRELICDSIGKNSGYTT